MSISLTRDMRNSLNSLSDINSAIEVSNKRLATGKKVNSALDNANAYFTSEGFKKDSRDFQNVLSAMDNGLKLVDKSVKAIEGARKLIESATALARQAKAAGPTDPARNTLGTQAAELVQQAQRLFIDAGFNGKNLLQADNLAPVAADNLVIQTNLKTVAAEQTSITLTAQDYRAAAATGIYGAALTTATTGVNATVSAGPDQVEAIAYTANSWQTDDVEIDGFISLTTAASNNLATRGQVLATAATTLQVRNDFTKDTQRILNAASDNLTLADMNEEGANLTTLQTRQQMAVTSMSLAGRSDQAILRLF
jgi:flagellin